MCSLNTLAMAQHGSTCELGYDRLDGTRKIGPSHAKSVIYIWHILDKHGTGTKHIVCHRRKFVVQWSVISKFAYSCFYLVKSPAVFWLPQELRKGRAWVGFQHSGCFLGAGSCPAWRTRPTSGLLSQFELLYTVGGSAKNKIRTQNNDA